MRVQLGPFQIDLDDGTVNGDACLTQTERRLLARLLAAEGAVVRRARLLVDVWGYHPRTKTRAIDATVLRLRKKIELDATSPTHLLSVRGQGWRLRVPARVPASPETTDARALLATVPGIGPLAVAELASALDDDPALARDVLPTLVRHGLEGRSLFAEALAPRFLARSATLSDADQALCRRLSLFRGGFDVAAVQAVAPGPADVECLDRLVDQGALLARQGTYRLGAVLRIGWRPTLVAEDWAALDVWLLNDQRSLVGGLPWLQRHVRDVLDALDRNVPLTEVMLLLTSDIVAALPAHAERVAQYLAAQGTTPRHRLFENLAAGAAGRTYPPSDQANLWAQAQAGDAIACVVGLTVASWAGSEARRPWADLLLKSDASPEVEARYLPREASRLAPADYQRRVRRLRDHAHQHGWRGVQDFLATCDANNDLIHERFVQVVARPATSTERLLLRAIAWFGLADDRRALEDCSRGMTDVPETRLIGAMLHAIPEPDVARALLGEVFRGVRQHPVHDIAYILQDLLDGRPPKASAQPLQSILQGALPSTDLRRPAVVALHILLRRRGHPPSSTP